MTVWYNAPENGTLSFALINLNTSAVTSLGQPIEVTAGSNQAEFQVGGLPNGNYALRAVFNDGVYVKNLIKI